MSRKRFISFFLLCQVGFWVDFAIMAGIVALPFLILDHLPNGNTAISGNVFAIQMAVYTITCLLTSRIVGKSKNILSWARWGVIIFTFSYPLYPFFPSKYAFYLLSAMAFIGMAITWPAFYAWVGTETNETKRQRNLAFFNIAWSLGFTISPLVAGPLYDIDFRLPYILIFFISILSFIFLLFIQNENSHYNLKNNSPQNSESNHNGDETNNLFLYPFWIGVFLANLMSIIPRSTYAEHLKKLVSNNELRFLFENSVSPILTGDPATKFSWPSAMMAFTTAGVFLLFAWTYFWKHRISLLIISQGICAITFYLLSETKSILLICISFAVIGANHGLTFFASTYYSVNNPVLRHGRASINEGLVGLGGVVGSLIFGFLVDKYGVTISYKYITFLVFFVILAELLLFYYLRKKVKLLHDIEKT
ncbi:MAG: MFS transporter [Candidatus Hydrogenedens sp.]